MTASFPRFVELSPAIVEHLKRLHEVTTMEELQSEIVRFKSVAEQPRVASDNAQHIPDFETPEAEVAFREAVERIANARENGSTELAFGDLEQLSHLPSMHGLPRLQTLSLKSTQVSDLSPLANLSELQTLNLMRTQVSDLHPIARLFGLQKLYLMSTQVSDLSPIRTLMDSGLDVIHLKYKSKIP